MSCRVWVLGPASGRVIETTGPAEAAPPPTIGLTGTGVGSGSGLECGSGLGKWATDSRAGGLAVAVAGAAAWGRSWGQQRQRSRLGFLGPHTGIKLSLLA